MAEFRSADRGAWQLRRMRFYQASLSVSRRTPQCPGVDLQLRLGRSPFHFFGGVGGAPFAEGFDAFCLGGPAFFGFRISLPFTIFNSFPLVGVGRGYRVEYRYCPN